MRSAHTAPQYKQYDLRARRRAPQLAKSSDGACGWRERQEWRKRRKPRPPRRRCSASPGRASRSSVEILASGRSGRPSSGCGELKQHHEIVVVADDVVIARQTSTRARRSWPRRGSSSRSREARSRTPRSHPWRSVRRRRPRSPRRRRRRQARRRRRRRKGLVIVAVGLPGAGKSRFHKKYLAGRDVVRCCQDLLGRSRCLALVEETVRAGQRWRMLIGGMGSGAARALGGNSEALQRRGRRVTVHGGRLYVHPARAPDPRRASTTARSKAISPASSP